MAIGRRIMVIDDDATIRELLVATLEDEGYEVRAVTGGRAGLALLADWAPGLVLLDLYMADIDGAGFLEASRQHGVCTFQVLLLSAAADLDAAASRLGVAAALPKPFDLERLIATVRQLLAR